MLRRHAHTAFFCFFGIGVAACGAEESPHGLGIAVAPLQLDGIGVACYDLAVTTAQGTVWTKGDPSTTRLGHDQDLPADPDNAVGSPDDDTVCSDRFGNSRGGDITYIGTCDASAEADTVPGGGVQNSVTIWVDGLYDDGLTAEMGQWQDPCPDGCVLQADCRENADTLVEFNLTVMRDAQQGFFDIIVNFEDIFCSSKLDTCYGDTDASEHIELLFGDDSDRDWTAVFGLACSAGVGADTVLAYGDIRVVCDDATFLIDPKVEPGSNHTATSGGNTLQYGVYRGNEQLECDTGEGDEPCAKRYWNLAFNLSDLVPLGVCNLQLVATVTDGNEGFANGVPTGAGVVYPYVTVDADLTRIGDSGAEAFCQENPINGGGGVTTTYHGGTDGATNPPTVCSQFDGTTVSDDCDLACPCWDIDEVRADIDEVLSWDPLQYVFDTRMVPPSIAMSVAGKPIEEAEGYTFQFRFDAQLSGDNGVYRCAGAESDSTDGTNRKNATSLSAAEYGQCLLDLQSLVQPACPCWDVAVVDDMLADISASDPYAISYAHVGSDYALAAAGANPNAAFQLRLAGPSGDSPGQCAVAAQSEGDDTSYSARHLGLTPQQFAACELDVQRFAAPGPWVCNELDATACPQGYDVNYDTSNTEQSCSAQCTIQP